MAKSFARAGASQIAIGARSKLTSQREEVLAAAAEAKRPVPEVLVIVLDITDRKSTEDAAALVEKEFGRLDIVVNNAGILKSGMVTESDPDEWWETFNVNLKGPYLVTKAFLPLLLKGGDKTIVTTSSVGAHCVSPTLSAYQTSKLAVLRFTEFVSKEYAGQGVLAYAIHPGNIPTDMLGGVEMTPKLQASELILCARDDWTDGR
jgi:NAD(P)-dependent dehydrogenase (short-subunit alcohol dehydrogenase family)